MVEMADLGKNVAMEGWEATETDDVMRIVVDKVISCGACLGNKKMAHTRDHRCRLGPDLIREAPKEDPMEVRRRLRGKQQAPSISTSAPPAPAPTTSSSPAAPPEAITIEDEEESPGVRLEPPPSAETSGSRWAIR